VSNVSNVDPNCPACGEPLGSVVNCRNCVNFAAATGATIPVKAKRSERLRLLKARGIPLSLTDEERALPPSKICGATLECGAQCGRRKKHDGPCLCGGDDEGPGSCPA